MKPKDLKLLTAVLVFLLVVLGFSFFLGSQQSQDTRSRAVETIVNLIQNPSFEEWESGLPKYWKGEKSDIKQSEDVSNGQYALQIVSAVKKPEPLKTGGNTRIEGGLAREGFNMGPGSVQNLNINNLKNKASISTKTVFVPGSASQTFIGLKANTDYTATFMAKGDEGVASLSYNINIEEAKPSGGGSGGIFGEWRPSQNLPLPHSSNFSPSGSENRVVIPGQNNAQNNQARIIKKTVLKTFTAAAAYTLVSFKFTTPNNIANGNGVLTFKTARTPKLNEETQIFVDDVNLTGVARPTPTSTLTPTAKPIVTKNKPVVTALKTLQGDKKYTLNISWVVPDEQLENLDHYEYSVWTNNTIQNQAGGWPLGEVSTRRTPQGGLLGTGGHEGQQSTRTEMVYIVNWTSALKNISITVQNLALTAGKTYYASARAVDTSGKKWPEGKSAGIVIAKNK